MKLFIRLLLVTIILLTVTTLNVQAQETASYSNDLYIEPGDVRVQDGNILSGSTVRLYTTVHNSSGKDLFGVVKFYNEREAQFIGTDQPVSVIGGGTDDVFIDWTAGEAGNHDISVRITPWSETGDNPANNKVTKTIYVDVDSDGDGTGDRLDSDDDNDGTPDNLDAFPNDPNEQEDTDEDGIGDNEDTDDDNDGVTDVEDRFPKDALETADRDGDGVGDHADLFPSDPAEWKDSDGDGWGDNSDPDNENQGPVAKIEIPNSSAVKGEVVTFHALKSFDPDGTIESYAWDFGDGLSEEGVVVDHVFKKTGTYQVTLKVTDDKGEYRTETLELEVRLRWQTLALIIVTALLVLLLLGHEILGWGKGKTDMDFEEVIHKVRKPKAKTRSLKNAVAKKSPKKSLPQKKK